MTRIVLADDHPIVRQGLRTILEAEDGWTVVGEAADGLTAVDVISELQPDVAIVDVMMPDLNGFETLERLRADERTASIPVVMVTGRVQAADVELGQAMGVAAYLTKPFEPAELVEVVGRFARDRRTARLEAERPARDG